MTATVQGVTADMDVVENTAYHRLCLLYKGALTHYLRLGPHMVLVFGILEQLKLLMR